MGLDPSQIAASVAKSAEVSRSQGGSQRASEIAQHQLASESTAALDRKKAEAAEHIRREKIRQDREKRRRQMERHDTLKKKQGEDADGDSTLDLVA